MDGQFTTAIPRFALRALRGKNNRLSMLDLYCDIYTLDFCLSGPFLLQVRLLQVRPVPKNKFRTILQQNMIQYFDTGGWRTKKYNQFVKDTTAETLKGSK